MIAELLVLAAMFGPAPAPPPLDPPVVVDSVTISTEPPPVPAGMRRVCEDDTEIMPGVFARTCYFEPVPEQLETFSDAPDRRFAEAG